MNIETTAAAIVDTITDINRLTAQLVRLQHQLQAGLGVGTTERQRLMVTASVFFGVPIRLLLSRRRTDALVFARSCCAHVLDEQGFTHGEIAEVLHRERSTISKDLQELANRCATNPVARERRDAFARRMNIAE